MKTKLGISVGMMGAAIYFSGLFSGYIVLVLMVGYTLLFEENEWLKKSAVKAFAVVIGFSILSALVDFIPNAITIIDDAMNIFGKDLSIAIVSKFVTLINTILFIAQKIVLLVLGFKAFRQSTVKIGIIDNTIHKHMN